MWALPEWPNDSKLKQDNAKLKLKDYGHNDPIADTSQAASQGKNKSEKEEFLLLSTSSLKLGQLLRLKSLH